MSDKIKHVTDTTFNSESPRIIDPGAGRLLGRMVRSVQDDCAGAG